MGRGSSRRKRAGAAGTEPASDSQATGPTSTEPATEPAGNTPDIEPANNPPEALRRVMVEVICEGFLGHKLLKKGDQTDDPRYVALLGDPRRLVKEV